MEPKEIYSKLEELYPKAYTELQYRNIFELVIAVVLSAQTTDVAVNKVTPKLFSKYPTPFALSQADVEDVEEIISSIGLYKTKAKNIINLAKVLVSNYNGNVPNVFEELIKLPGVGRKSANVILSEGFNIPRIAVDTHVLRVSNRLGFADSQNPAIVEKELMEKFLPSQWHQLHLRLILFGRYFCKSKPKKCHECPFQSICRYLKHEVK